MARPAVPPAMKDALLSAVVAKLPPPGAAWPAAEREAWFVMMRNAVDVAYGPVERPSLNSRLAEIKRLADEQGTQVQLPLADVNLEAPKVTSPARFCIDPDGYALRDDSWIDPAEIPPGAVVHDYRRQPVNEETDPIMWRSHGSMAAALPAGVVIAAATQPWKGKAYNGKTTT